MVATGGSSNQMDESTYDGPPADDPLMTLLTSRVQLEDGRWKLDDEPHSCYERTCHGSLSSARVPEEKKFLKLAHIIAYTYTYLSSITVVFKFE